MNIVKSLSRGLLALLFKVSVILLLIVAPIVMVFGTSNTLKSSLKESDIYSAAVDGIIDSIHKDADKSGGDNPFKDPSVQQAAKSALSPVFLQKSSESIIDGMYGWLSGKTARPEFTIDASGVKEQFIKAVGDYAVNRAKRLPACTVAQLRTMSTNIDPLTADCVPPGYNVENLRTLVTEQLNKPSENGEQNILQQPIITADTLPKDENGKTPVQNATENGNNARTIFRWLLRAPMLLSSLAVISGGLLVLLYDDKRRAVRNLAVTVLPVGVVGLLGVFVTQKVFAALEKSDAITKADNAIQQPLIALLHSLSGAVNQKLLLIAGIYTVLGAGTLIALHYTKPKTPEAVPATDTPAPNELAVKEESPQKPAEKSVKPKKLVQ